MTIKPHPYGFPRRALLSLAGGGALFFPELWSRPGRAAAATDDPIDQPDYPNPQSYIARAFELRDQATRSGDQGYGAVVARDSGIVGQSQSLVVLNRDPTAHAEMEAIRDAARRLGSRDLSGTVLYSSSSPCPMCEAAAYWAGIARLIHGRSLTDGGPPKLCR